MVFRAFILSILIISYGSVLGHEVIFGHHTDAEINCHHHGHDCCDHSHGDQDHTPCLVDIDPHFGSVQEITINPDNGPQFEINLYILLSLLNPDFYLIDDKGGPPDRMIQDLYSSLFQRSHGLRGPPVA